MDNTVEKTSKTSVRRRNFRPVIFIAVPVIMAGIVIAILINRKPTESPKDNQPETVATKTEGKKEELEEKKEEGKKPAEEEPEEDKGSEVVDGKTPVQQDESPEISGDLTGVINYADSDGETVMIRVSIDQYLENGTCLLELTSANDSFSLSDNIATSASTSSCSFDIATSLLNSGKYDIKITLSSDGKTGLIEGEVDV